VIIFDRVREHFRTMRRASVTEIIDSAITATISRTMITHGSTLCMTLSIYSSIFVAAAIAMYLGVRREDLVKPVKKEEPTQELIP